MIMTLIAAFIAQPTLAASIATQMQLDTQKRLAQSGDQSFLSQAPRTQKSMPLENHESHCPHAMMMTSNTMDLDHAIAPAPQSKFKGVFTESGQDDCLTTCQFCMSISCIIPETIAELPNQEAFIPHFATMQDPVSISHIPAHQPPRLYS